MKYIKISFLFFKQSYRKMQQENKMIGYGKFLI